VTESPFQDLLPLGAARAPEAATQEDPPATAAADGATAPNGRGAGPLAHDPALAARMLDEAGWRVDPGTGVRTRAGRQFRFTLLIYSSGENHAQFAQVAQDDLRRLGIRMSIERLDWPTLWSRLKSGSFQAALSGMIPAPDPDSIYGLLHSSQIQGGQNYAAYRDAETDDWLDAGRRTVDVAARESLYRRIEKRLADQQPYTFLFSPAVPAVLNARFEGLEPSPLGLLGSSPGAAALRLRREQR
jgi:peptide/nickel transport system substrate-binding protein